MHSNANSGMAPSVHAVTFCSLEFQKFCGVKLNEISEKSGSDRLLRVDYDIIHTFATAQKVMTKNIEPYPIIFGENAVEITCRLFCLMLVVFSHSYMQHRESYMFVR